MAVNNISAIFEVVPTSWGLRGDPYFWEDLKHHFANCTLPYCVQDFENEVRSFFYEITGEPLTGDCQVYVAKYAHGGMSSGMICGSFWTDHGIPLLVKRLKKIT